MKQKWEIDKVGLKDFLLITLAITLILVFIAIPVFCFCSFMFEWHWAIKLGLIIFTIFELLLFFSSFIKVEV